MFAVFAFAFFSCNGDNDLQPENEVINKIETAERLSFIDEKSLAEVVASSDFNNEYNKVKMNHQEFISFMDEVPVLRSSEIENKLTYIEIIGLDTLIHNPNFARLLNSKGELQVGSEVIRVTPKGTYRYSINYENEFNLFIDNNTDYIGYKIDEDEYRINDQIRFYKTFEEHDNDYSLLTDAELEALSCNNVSSAFEVQTRAAEPNFNSFSTFKADRKTIIGKIIQNLIGASKTHTLMFETNSNRKLQGTFYFQNYGVYADIGVKGLTKKKNVIGWSGTDADEIRVGWDMVLLKKSIPNYYSQALKDIQSIGYFPPQYTSINGERVNMATLIMPDFEADLKQKIISQGVKALYDYAKNKLGSKPTDFDKANGWVIASKHDVYYIIGKKDIIRTKEEKINHLFAQTWMEFEVGWSNTNGFFINNVNQNNYDQLKTWGNAIAKVLSQEKTTLVAGEVYVCARFGSEWQGMKIIKKEQ